MKRKIYAFLLSAMSIFSLTSCDLLNNTSKDSSTSPNTTTEAPTTSTTEAPTTTTTGGDVNPDEAIVDDVIFDDFQIHFLELGNSYAGDSVYIKYNDYDILIDAGSRTSSATTIKSYIDTHSNDKKLEYVIATHAHQDHIAGFVGTNNSGILYSYPIDNIIDFSLQNTTSAISKNYVTARDYAVSQGATRYAASSFFESDSSNVISIGQDLKLTILYNKYYFEKSSDENNYSVCTLFTYKEHNFMMTGDLEKEGEEALAEYYDNSKEELTLPHCDLFKAGHHGSKTSSNDCLLSKITPDICVACCCAGSTEYTTNYENIFPTQEFINRIALYTDRVYATTQFNFKTKEFESLNGDVVISSNGTQIGVKGSNNNEKLKDTAWFNETIYVINGKIPKQSADQYDENTAGAIAVPRRVWPTT